MQNANCFGVLLRDIRVGCNKTLKELAEHMGWSTVYLSDIERGKRNPPNETFIVKISEFLCCSAIILLNAADKQKKRVELDLVTDNTAATEAALMLARRWTDVTPEQAEEIMNILGRE